MGAQLSTYSSVVLLKATGAALENEVATTALVTGQKIATSFHPSPFLEPGCVRRKMGVVPVPKSSLPGQWWWQKRRTCAGGGHTDAYKTKEKVWCCYVCPVCWV